MSAHALPAPLVEGKTNDRCLFGHTHTTAIIGEATACSTCGRLSIRTARTLGVDLNKVKVNVRQGGWMIYLRDAVTDALAEGGVTR